MEQAIPSPLPTEFALAERVSAEDLQQVIAQFSENPERFELLDASPDVIMILNKHRQVVYANAAIEELLGLEDRRDAYGKRPGELMGCVHASRHEEGSCGTTRHCSMCGAVKAVLISLSGRISIQEASINQEGMKGSFDLRVWGRPYEADGENYSLVAVKDITDEKRRTALEHAFFHDILDTAGGLLGYAELMEDASPEELEEMNILEVMPQLATQLIEEINSHRLLVEAESGDLALEPVAIAPQEFLEGVASVYMRHQVGEHRHILVDLGEASLPFTSDRALLSRVVGNMVKNALEACVEGETVSLGWRYPTENVEIWVHNPSVMSEEIQLQVFQRSFSTKGKGRGLGTYCMKLLGERYLRGEMGFESNKETGTTFTVRLPRRFEG